MLGAGNLLFYGTHSKTKFLHNSTVCTSACACTIAAPKKEKNTHWIFYFTDEKKKFKKQLVKNN